MKNSGVIAWLFTGLATTVAVAYAVVLALGPPNMTATVLDFSAKVIGPLGAALIAWAGVSHTVANSRLQDTAKEWHQDSAVGDGAVPIGRAETDRYRHRAA